MPASGTLSLNGDEQLNFNARRNSGIKLKYKVRIEDGYGRNFYKCRNIYCLKFIFRLNLELYLANISALFVPLSID
jgi:hypothetical protein